MRVKHIKDPMEILKEFCESSNISPVSQEIVEEYIMDMTIENVKPSTLLYNAKIMKYFLSNVKTDLDKLDVKDCKQLQAALHNKDCAESTKKMYMIGFKRFLHWYGRNKGNRKYMDLADSMKRKSKIERKVPSDLLTESEIMQMIEATTNHRDAAIIATLYESGCRINELLSCRIKDIEFVSSGCKITFPKSKTESRTILLVFATGYIQRYLSKHHDKNNPDSPLFITNSKQSIGTKEKPASGYKVIEYSTIHMIIRDIAKAAGIKKRVYPHLFRHTRATILSKSNKISEANLRNMLGWAPGSYMPSIYVHLSGEDSANAVRELYGLIDPQKTTSGIEMGICIRCKEPNPVGESLCRKCSLPLTKEAEQMDTILNQALSTYFTQNPNTQVDLMKTILSQSK